MVLVWCQSALLCMFAGVSVRCFNVSVDSRPCHSMPISCTSVCESFVNSLQNVLPQSWQCDCSILFQQSSIHNTYLSSDMQEPVGHPLCTFSVTFCCAPWVIFSAISVCCCLSTVPSLWWDTDCIFLIWVCNVIVWMRPTGCDYLLDVWIPMDFVGCKNK